MKLAWLVWKYSHDEEPTIVFSDPGSCYCKVVPIVYMEVIPT